MSSDPQVLAYYEGRDNPHDLTKVQEKLYTNLSRCAIFVTDINKKNVNNLQQQNPTIQKQKSVQISTQLAIASPHFFLQ
ncbi:hypothetical protein [Spirulina sp. 06S082]|uniref:hypothetical protein n=1 Tax=Spirulina sp. 06S082 TaxID=3110248 RepID=UPI002B211C79|nr:hypothetical protein [Spirulina sp. 06S082]MEA5468779.1 hypothetical protein [Spirulina sp. 06S082]